MNQDEYSSLNKVNKIDESVLNTPAQEPKKIQQPSNDSATETYFQLNKPQQFNPKGDVVLQLDGKSIQVDDQTSLDNKSQLLQQVYGSTAPGVSIENRAGPYIMFTLIILGLIIFIMMNLKRSEYILNLEKEINKIKKDRYGGF